MVFPHTLTHTKKKISVLSSDICNRINFHLDHHIPIHKPILHNNHRCHSTNSIALLLPQHLPEPLTDSHAILRARNEHLYTHNTARSRAPECFNRLDTFGQRDDGLLFCIAGE